MPRADRTTGTRPDEDAPEPRPVTPPTVVLLVRHGTTTTTGKELPGRAPGLHLAPQGTRQAADVARRIVALTARPPADAAADGDGSPAPPSANGSSGDAPSAGTSPPGTAGDGAAREATGPEQAAASPHGHAVAAVYASPLERTRETAAPIAEALGLAVEVDEGLLELDVGDWTGLALSEAAKRPEWSTIQRYPSGFAFPGGESFLAMQARMVGTLDRLRRLHPGRTVVAVSHADPIRAAVAHAMGTHLDLFQRVVVSPCSLSAIAYGDGGPVVLTVNATGDPGPLVPS